MQSSQDKLFQQQITPAGSATPSPSSYNSDNIGTPQDYADQIPGKKKRSSFSSSDEDSHTRKKKKDFKEEIPTTTTPREEDNKPKKARKNETICTHCEKGGDLLMCDGQCLRSFHVSCLGPNAQINMTTNADGSTRWECNDCLNQQNYCFSCKKRGIIGMDLMKCKVHQCGKFYHYKCVSEFKLAKLINTKSPRFNCPLHYCSVCQVSGDGKQSVHCFRCPTAYHVICMQPGVKMLTKSKETRKTGLVLCPKHCNESIGQCNGNAAKAPLLDGICQSGNNNNVVSPNMIQQLPNQHHHHHHHHNHQNHHHQQQPQQHHQPQLLKSSSQSGNGPSTDSSVNPSHPLYYLMYTTSPMTTPGLLSPVSPISSPPFSPVESPRYPLASPTHHQSPINTGNDYFNSNNNGVDRQHDSLLKYGSNNNFNNNHSFIPQKMTLERMKSEIIEKEKRQYQYQQQHQQQIGDQKGNEINGLNEPNFDDLTSYATSLVSIRDQSFRDIDSLYKTKVQQLKKNYTDSNVLDESRLIEQFFEFAKSRNLSITLPNISRTFA
eukprot:gene9282-11377_t